MATRRRGRLLFAIWQAGGGTQPELGLVRLLASRGHEVHVLAPAIHRARVERAGAEWVGLPPECEFDPAEGRALEDQEAFVLSMLLGTAVPEALLETAASLEPEVVAVDQQLYTTLCAAELLPARRIALAHTAFRFHGARPSERGFRILNNARRELGLDPIQPADGPVALELLRRADRTLVVMTPEFDPWPDPPRNAVHVGPLFEEDPASFEWQPPWPADRKEPLVVVSLSSQYMHQEDLLGRIGEALGGLPLRLLFLLGFELGAAEVGLPPDAVVERYVPHLAVLPEAAAVVTHGGVGTIMAAFSCGVPLVCIPLGRDQEGNASRVEELDAGLALPADASAASIQDAVGQALDSKRLREGARRMAETVERYGDGEQAVAELERLLT